jgi:DNA-binding transcriptional regulator YiaG
MTRIIDYRYDECGLDNVILKNLRVVTDHAGEDAVTIPNVSTLHRVLTATVASKETGLQPKEIRFLRTELGLTQAQLAELVGKDSQTVGRWERGETPIEQSAEMVVRLHALQLTGGDELPSMQDMARWTIKSASNPPFVINAEDPDHYRAIAA